MSYYINSPIGNIYFRAPKKSSVLISQNSFVIRRLNISFLDEDNFFKFSNFYNWSSMKIINMNYQYYLCIHLSNDTYELLNIYYDHNKIKNKNKTYYYL